MKLWFRMIWYLLTVFWRPKISLPEEPSRLRSIVWPSDLDTSMHMNNGIYLTIMDLGRLDLMVCGGLWNLIWTRNLTPIASAIKIRYRREMRPWNAFTLHTKIACWDETFVVIAQDFILESGPRKGQVAAQALFKGGIYDRSQRQFVPIRDLMDAIGVDSESPSPTAEVEAFLKADSELKNREHPDDA